MRCQCAIQRSGKYRHVNSQNGEEQIVPEVIESWAAYIGRLSEILFQMTGGLRSGLGYKGLAKLDLLCTQAQFA